MSSAAYSLKQSDSARLKPDTAQGPLDFAQHSLKHPNDFAEAYEIANSLHFVKNYVRGDLVVVVEFATKWRSGNFSLIFQSIPTFSRKARTVKAARDCVANYRAPYGVGDNEFMFIGVTHLVQGPKHSIPSLVWFAFEHRLKDRIRNIDGSPLPFFSWPKNFSPFIPEGKMGIRAPLATGTGSGKASMVKCGAQVVENVKNNSRYFNGHRFNKLDFEYILMGARITLIDGLAGVTFHESGNDHFQLAQASLCVVDAVS